MYPNCFIYPWFGSLLIPGEYNKLESSRGEVNILMPRQNGRHLEDIFKRVLLHENVQISIKISLNFAT